MSKAAFATEFRLKILRPGSIPAALERAERYRLLNEPAQAESICLDILEADRGNQHALITLLLSITDQFEDVHHVERANALVPHLTDAYHRAYYQGIVFERRARVHLHRMAPGGSHTAYYFLREAMQCYDIAEAMRPADNDEAILRWNTCARTIMSENLQPTPPDDSITMSE
jgi:hypothetical protein